MDSDNSQADSGEPIQMKTARGVEAAPDENQAKESRFHIHIFAREEGPYDYQFC